MGSSVANTAEEIISKPPALDLEECSKTTDIIARRRMQNTLAQRLRRKKLREGKTSHTTPLELSKEESLTSTPETLKADQSTPYLIPSESHITLDNVSDGVPNLPVVSMTEGEIAALLSRLDQTLAQLQEQVSARPSESQLSTSKPSLDSTYPSQAYWNPYLMPAFDTNHPGTWSNSFGVLTPVQNDNTNDTAGRRDSLTSTDNAVSTDLRDATVSPWSATSKPRKASSSVERLVLTSLPHPPKPTHSCFETFLTSNSISETLLKSALCTNPAYVRPTSYNSNSQTAAISCARGSTALHLAAQQGHFETVSLLLESGGVDIDACNSDGLSALHIAVSNNHTNMAHLLLTHGASSTLRTNAGLSILHLAVRHGTLPLVLLVLRYMTMPGDLDLRDHDGRSAFHLAVARGDKEIVRSLLEKGANLMAKVGD